MATSRKTSITTSTTTTTTVNKDKDKEKEKEKEEKSRQIEQLHRNNALMVENLKNLHPQERELVLAKKGYIDQLGRNFKRLHELGAIDKPLSSISMEVYSFLKANDVLITQRYVQMLLPKEYKMETKPAGQNRSNIEYDIMEDENPELLPEEDVDMLSREEELKPNPIWGRAEETLIQKPIDEMTNDELRQVTERTILSTKQKREDLRETARRSEYLQEECEHRKVALDPEVIKPREPPISAVSLDSGPSLSSTAAGELEQAWGRVKNKLLKYRPPPDLDKKIAAGLRVQVELLEPYADEKFRKDILSWFKIEADKCRMGKNASAKRNATKFSPEIQKLLNILKRDLTREQVGDNFLPMLELSARVLENQDTMLVMNLWYLSVVEPEIAKRVVKMNPKLSALA